MTPQAFAIGQHVWSVSHDRWACRCGQHMTEWRDGAGRAHYTPEAKPCTYRPQRRMGVERDSTGTAVKLFWLGDF